MVQFGTFEEDTVTQNPEQSTPTATGAAWGGRIFLPIRERGSEEKRDRPRKVVPRNKQQADWNAPKVSLDFNSALAVLLFAQPHHCRALLPAAVDRWCIEDLLRDPSRS